MKHKSMKLNAVLNVIKQICSIIFPMITFPYASRVLGTYYYGKINFGSSIISYIALIAGLGITNYAIREGARVRDNHKKLEVLCSELFSINCISTLLAYIILVIIVKFYNKLDGYTELLIIQSTTILFTTIGTDWINSIYEDYTYITIRYIVCQSIAVILVFFLVKRPEDYLNYAIASVSGGIFANILNLIYIRKHFNIKLKFTKEMNIKLHLKPIMVLFGTAVASLVYINSDITMLGILKDEKTVGLYSVSARIYSLVKQVLNALLIVSIPRVSNEISSKSNELNSHLSKIFGFLILIIGASCVGLFMLSKDIIVLFSGINFISATSSLQILSISLLFATIACFYINVVLIPYRKEKEALIATIISGSLNIVLNFILIPLFGQNAAAFTTLLSEATMASLGFIYSKNIIKIQIKKYIFIGFVNCILTTIICYLVSKLKLSSLLNIMTCISFSLFACFIVLFISYREIFNVFINKVKKRGIL